MWIHSRCGDIVSYVICNYYFENGPLSLSAAAAVVFVAVTAAAATLTTLFIHLHCHPVAERRGAAHHIDAIVVRVRGPSSVMTRQVDRFTCKD